MGQRTQMLVIRKVTDENGKERVTKSIYHKQWGQGRQMYIGMMSAITNYLGSLNPDDFRPTTAGFYPVHSGNNRDLTEEERQEEARFLKDADIDRQDTLADVFSRCDNNDGALVVELTHKRHKNYEVEYGIRAGFLLNGTMGRDRFKDMVPPVIYAAHVGGGYMSAQFLRMFEDFCGHLQVEWIERKEDKAKTA